MVRGLSCLPGDHDTLAYLWEVLTPRTIAPVFHEDNQAMFLAIVGGRYPTMWHAGRVQRVVVQWLHARLGKHVDRDRTIFFHEGTRNTSADIYTKSLGTLETWDHALHFINVFKGYEIQCVFSHLLVASAKGCLSLA